MDMKDNSFLKSGPNTNIFKKMWNSFKNSTMGPVLITITVILLIACGFVKFVTYMEEEKYPKGNYELVYKVYYTPNHVKEYTIKHDRPISVYSSDGSNYIRKRGEGIVVQTSAPIEVVKYVRYN